jgi:hypothetical protein
MPLVRPQIASLLLRKGVDVGRQAGKHLAGTLAFACMVALNGCSGPSEDEQPATPASAVDEPSTEPTQPESQQAPGPPVERPVEPVPPVQAQGTTVRSAEAFVGYYIDLLNYAMVTGDTEAFRAASMDCEGCERYADLFDEVAARGGSAETRGWTVDEIATSPMGKKMFIVFNADAARVRSKPSADASTALIPPATYALRLVLARSPSGWKATQFTRS